MAESRPDHGTSRQMNAEYYRYISYLDAQIGSILDTLEASSFSKNTTIVFSADSGAARCSHGLIGRSEIPSTIGGKPVVSHAAIWSCDGRLAIVEARDQLAMTRTCRLGLDWASCCIRRLPKRPERMPQAGALKSIDSQHLDARSDVRTSQKNGRGEATFPGNPNLVSME